MALTVEKRLTPSKKWMVLSIFIALGASAIVSAILLKFTGADVGMAYAALFDGAFGDTRAIGKTLIKATPIILTGIAVTVAFRAKIWNIGAEGQLFAGALASYWAYLLLGLGPVHTFCRSSSWQGLLVVVSTVAWPVSCGLAFESTKS